MKVRIYFFLIVLVLVSSCGVYERTLKSTDFELKKAYAKQYYAEGQYAKTTELLSQILARYRATEEAEELNWINATAYYKMKDYYMASTYYKSFIEMFPFGVHAEEAYFLAAMCDYMISPRPELDQDNTNKAIEGFKIFMNKFPYSEKFGECGSLIKELEEKLVEKSYLNAKLYYQMNEYKAAVTALNNSLKEHADTKYREEMMFLKLNSLFLYAENSAASKQKERYQATLDDYFSFMEEYPSSTYSKDINRIFQKTDSYLKTGIPDSGINN